MGYRHSREEILRAAVAAALELGIARLTYAAVGARLGISDRTVVYYFPTKDALVMAVVQALGSDLEAVLESAFGSEPLLPADLLRRAWPLLASDAADPVFALYFEVVGLAMTGVAPFHALAEGLLQGWLEWLTPRVIGSDPEKQRDGALAAIAQLDGLLLLRQVLGPAAADRAAHAAGILGESGNGAR